MAKLTEVGRLKSLVRRYRRLTGRLLAEGESYTDGMHCVFCSEDDGAESDDDEIIRHIRRFPTRKAEELAAMEI